MKKENLNKTLFILPILLLIVVVVGVYRLVRIEFLIASLTQAIVIGLLAMVIGRTRSDFIEKTLYGVMVISFLAGVFLMWKAFS